jgi:hypothetical protein
MAAVASANIYLFQGFRLDRRARVRFQQDQQGVFVPLAIGRRALDILAVLADRPRIRRALRDRGEPSALGQASSRQHPAH